MKTSSSRAAFLSLSALVAAIGAVVTPACSGSDDSGISAGSDSGPRGVEPAGQSCTAAAQCYAGVDAGADGGVVGEATCLTKIENGYCTHTCQTDGDCCAVPGECLTSVKEVCSPFENQGAQYCFLSCEDADIARAIAANASSGYYDGGATDAASSADAYCQSYAGSATSCRSSGGGTQNRKVCIPKE
ncbi:MAG: hypothetical protein JWP97_1618 [Labilithrix sp.]|nr:hypothetical protein [Labilithrix sp.]